MYFVIMSRTEENAYYLSHLGFGARGYSGQDFFHFVAMHRKARRATLERSPLLECFKLHFSRYLCSPDEKVVGKSSETLDLVIVTFAALTIGLGRIDGVTVRDFGSWNRERHSVSCTSNIHADETRRIGETCGSLVRPTSRFLLVPSRNLQLAMTLATFRAPDTDKPAGIPSLSNSILFRQTLAANLGWRVPILIKYPSLNTVGRFDNSS